MYGLFTYIYLIFMVTVGKYTSPMDPFGVVILFQTTRHTYDHFFARCFFPYWNTLPQTNIAPENEWLEDEIYFLDNLFRGPP